MRAKLDRTTPKERKALKAKVTQMVKDYQEFQDDYIEQKDNFPNVKKITATDYNPSNLFKELEIFDLYAFYVNAVSDREGFHTKNENYFKLVEVLGL